MSTRRREDARQRGGVGFRTRRALIVRETCGNVVTRALFRCVLMVTDAVPRFAEFPTQRNREFPNAYQEIFFEEQGI